MVGDIMMKQTTNERCERGGGRVEKVRQEGFALITALLVMLILTVLGVSAMTMTSMENRIAGVSKTTEAASMAVESCLGAGVNVIQQTIYSADVPLSVLDNAVPLPGPVPMARAVDLGREIMGELDQNNDSPTGTGASGPDMVQNVGGFTVNGDIDRLYVKYKAGGSNSFAEAEQGKGKAAEYDVYYRITCVATMASTGTQSQVSGVYACTASGGDTCQKSPF
jgi:Tfp pilus assembly protein PilX